MRRRKGGERDKKLEAKWYKTYESELADLYDLDEEESSDESQVETSDDDKSVSNTSENSNSEDEIDEKNESVNKIVDEGKAVIESNTLRNSPPPQTSVRSKTFFIQMYKHKF